MVKDSQYSLSSSFRHVVREAVQDSASQELTYSELMNSTRSTSEMLLMMNECFMIRQASEEQQRRLRQLGSELRSLEQRRREQRFFKRVNSIVKCLVQIDETENSCSNFRERMTKIAEDAKEIYNSCWRNLRPNDTPSEKLAIILLTITSPDKAKELKFYGSSDNDLAFFSCPNGSCHKRTPFGVLFRKMGVISGESSALEIDFLIKDTIKLIELVQKDKEES